MRIPLSLEAIRQRCGTATPRRQFLFARLQTIVQLLAETGQLRRFYLLGSFATAKPAPNDLDCLTVMAAGFTTELLAPPQRTVFQHDLCRLTYQADVFWVTEAIDQEAIEAMLDVFSRDREGASQPIIEVIL